MARQSITWVITDTHFYHDAIIAACNRPENFLELTIKNCKHLCYPQDTLIHLGDVIFYNYPNLINLLSHIQCKKILVMGNHDRKSKNWYMNNGFQFACDSFTNNDIIFSHKPLAQFPTGVTFNVHGHWHNLLNDPKEWDNLPEWWNYKTHYCLSIEEMGYKPIKLSQLESIKKKANETAV